MRSSRARTPLSAIHGRWLALTLLITLLPHSQYLPPWLSALCALLVVWRVAADGGLTRLPGRALLLLAAAAVVAGTAMHHHHLLGKDPGLALLAGLACLKLLESRVVRDGRALILLSFFLQLGQYLNGQEISVGIVTLLGTLFAVASLIALEADLGARASLRQSALLVMQALPFMLFLFLLFPRIQGPLWGLPADAYSSLTGLSDSMSPGSISELIRSGEVAFRAEFEQAPPPPRLRYWRGPIFSSFDGSTWRPGLSTLAETPAYTPTGPAYRYRMTLEAHNQQWLLALDYPSGPVPDARFSTDLQLLSVSPVRTRRRHELLAFPETRVGVAEREHRLERNLQLPADSNPRLQALGARLRGEQGDPALRVDALIATFRAQQLNYTLRPARLGVNAADDFFFDTRQGFCEHFSSAFAIAARAAGVPTRVVTGYQGGELNPHDGTLVVRQSDAHAWVEVWLAGRGWLRVDPTAASHPRRIDDGIAGALPDAEFLPLFIQPQLPWLRALRYRWEAMSNSWNQWVLGYNDERQRSFLQQIGFGAFDWKKLGVTLALLTGFLMFAYLGWALIKPVRGDRLDRLWATFCAKLARAGCARPAWQGPAQYAAEAAQRHPQHATAIRDIAETYARLRYGPGRLGARELLHLKNRIDRFQAP